MRQACGEFRSVDHHYMPNISPYRKTPVSVRFSGPVSDTGTMGGTGHRGENGKNSRYCAGNFILEMISSICIHH